MSDVLHHARATHADPGNPHGGHDIRGIRRPVRHLGHRPLVDPALTDGRAVIMARHVGVDAGEYFVGDGATQPGQISRPYRFLALLAQ